MQNFYAKWLKITKLMLEIDYVYLAATSLKHNVFKTNLIQINYIVNK